ncbi:MAG: osmotically inducible protein OsmC [Verrucomicrobia bacterium]|jgi:ribosomal protein S12 methylthiotransferase accessory factor|nr:osmotically inducible protein OsmC [Verrucomicrobiota bacterium]MBT7066510.1 osmotically inducible protein OsmC [Verrucomicrobiota bacterium]MBT7699942.1 osmotically inducible protein OsmC [Verrucomicrobiota bacterium]
MQKKIAVSFPGGKKVDASFEGWTIHTDQSVKNGGDNTAPNPFDLFFASLAACAGFYALEFCQARELSTEGLAVQLDAARDPAKKLFTPIRIAITLPQDFPDKYRKAILKTANLCTVKKHIINTPEFEVVLAD